MFYLGSIINEIQIISFTWFLNFKIPNWKVFLVLAMPELNTEVPYRYKVVKFVFMQHLGAA